MIHIGRYQRCHTIYFTIHIDQEVSNTDTASFSRYQWYMWYSQAYKNAIPTTPYSYANLLRIRENKSPCSLFRSLKKDFNQFVIAQCSIHTHTKMADILFVWLPNYKKLVSCGGHGNLVLVVSLKKNVCVDLWSIAKKTIHNAITIVRVLPRWIQVT